MNDFRDKIVKAYQDYLGDKLVALVLFGSRARGDAQETSDYDLFIVARDLPAKLMNKLSDKVASLAMERIVGLLAERVADRVVDSMMKAGFDKQFAASLLKALEREAKEEQAQR